MVVLVIHFFSNLQVSTLSRKLSLKHLVRAPRWKWKCEWTFTASSVCPVPPWLKCRNLMKQKSPWRQNKSTTKMNRFTPINVFFLCSFWLHIMRLCVLRPHYLYLKYKLMFFITHLKNKMQTDQEEQQNQGDCQKETEQKTSHENEEMEVRCLVSTWS